MKKYIALALLLAGFIAAPSVIRAEDDSTNAVAATTSAPKKHAGKAAHGTVSAVDATAQTITVSDKTYTVTSDTKIMKGKKTIALGDIVVGDSVTIATKKGEAGAVNAVSITVGGKKKKSDAGSTDASSPN